VTAQAGKLDREDVVIARPDRASLSRRALVRGAAASALLAAIGVPAPARAQSSTIRIGYLAPRGGQFASSGDYGVMGIELAVEEINMTGGVAGRRLELLLADSADPQVTSDKAERLITRDKVNALIGIVAPAAGAAIEETAKRASTCFIGTAPAAAAVPRAVQLPKAFVASFARRFGKPPQTQSWVDYCALKVAVRSITGTERIDPAGCREVIAPPTNACVR